MKLFLLLFMMVFPFLTSAQKEILQFDKNIWEVENQWISLKYKDTNDYYFYGYLCFNELGSGEYFLYNIGKFKIENNKFIKIDEFYKKFTPLSLVNISFAILPEKAVKELDLKLNDDLSIFNTAIEDKNNGIFKRAEAMSLLGEHKIALFGLKQLLESGHSSDRLFYQIMYNYNVLERFDEAEKIGKLAKEKGEYTEYVVKEYVFSLLRKDKILEGEAELKAHWDMIEHLTIKEETLYNLILALEYKSEFQKMKYWISIYNKNFPFYAKTKEQVNTIEKMYFKK